MSAIEALRIGREKGVRRGDKCTYQILDAGRKPASASSRLVAQLNDRWRVINDPLQWILQVRKGRATTKSTGWSGQSFCTERTALLRCIHEYCGPVDQATLRYLEDLPDLHREYENKKK